MQRECHCAVLLSLLVALLCRRVPVPAPLVIPSDWILPPVPLLTGSVCLGLASCCVPSLCWTLVTAALRLAKSPQGFPPEAHEEDRPPVGHAVDQCGPGGHLLDTWHRWQAGAGAPAAQACRTQRF